MMRLLLIALFLRCSAAASSPHPYIGCPRMTVLKPFGLGRFYAPVFSGDYDIVHSHAWRKKVENVWHILSVEDEGGLFKICEEQALINGLCTYTDPHSPNGYEAVCAYDANYCPTLNVTGGPCSGIYLLERHGFWSNDSKSIRIVEGNVFTSDSTQYECFDGEESQGMVSTVICNNPNINTPLVHGKNVLPDETVLYVVKDFIASPDVISFELTLDTSAEQVAWIWSKNAWGHGESSYFAFAQDTDWQNRGFGINYINIFSSDTNYFKFRLFDDKILPAVFRILSVRHMTRDSPHGGRIVVGRTETASGTAVALSGFSAAPTCFVYADTHQNKVRPVINDLTNTGFTVKFKVLYEADLSQSPFYYLCILAGVADMPHLLPGMHGSAFTLELWDWDRPYEKSYDIFPGEIGHRIVVGDMQTARNNSGNYIVISSTPKSDGSYLLSANAFANWPRGISPHLEAMGVLKLFRSADPRDPMYGEQQMVEAHPLAPYGGSIEKFAGCPEIYSFEDWKGYYSRVSDYHWRRRGANWNIGLVGNRFCNAYADGSCTGFYTTVAMCTAAQHFCPELVVLGASDRICRGVYIQESPYVWARSDGVHVSVKHFDPIYGRPRYGCHDENNSALGAVHETYCSTPSRVAPIFSGLNVLGDKKTYWIQPPRDMADAWDKITFTINMMHRTRLNVWMVTNSADFAKGGSLSTTSGCLFEGFDRTTFRFYCSSELVDVTLTKA